MTTIPPPPDQPGYTEPNHDPNETDDERREREEREQREREGRGDDDGSADGTDA